MNRLLKLLLFGRSALLTKKLGDPVSAVKPLLSSPWVFFDGLL
ncbi:MAG: hypothetical protein N2438_03895 [Limisphaera sp.]|nr:hypothetical protein [Limisphaera sp.]